VSSLDTEFSNLLLKNYICYKMQSTPTGFNRLPEVVKNLLIINGLFFLATYALERYGIDLYEILGLYYWKSAQFQPHQIITSMFMHGGLMHLAFNMFALWMFGSILENLWGGRKFLTFYIIAGIGGGLLYLLFKHFEYNQVADLLNGDLFQKVYDEGYSVLQSGKNWTDSDMSALNSVLNIPAVGASGAIYGLLVAFAMLFPNEKLMLIFPPIPIAAKYFVPALIALDLFGGFSSFNTGIAHFAHIGGALFGFLLLKYWESKGHKVI